MAVCRELRPSKALTAIFMARPEREEKLEATALFTESLLLEHFKRFTRSEQQVKALLMRRWSKGAMAFSMGQRSTVERTAQARFSGSASQVNSRRLLALAVYPERIPSMH